MSTRNLKLFSERLKLERRSQRVPLRELAKIAGVGTSAVAAWENGENWPRQDKLEKIAAHLRVPLAWLEGKTTMKPLVYPPHAEAPLEMKDEDLRVGLNPDLRAQAEQLRIEGAFNDLPELLRHLIRQAHQSRSRKEGAKSNGDEPNASIAA